MEIYDSRYFHLNKKYLVIMGLWPYTDWKRHTVRSIYIAMTLIFNVPHVLGMIVDRKDTDKLLDHVLAVSFLTGMFLKIFTISVSDGKMRIMFDAIVENWSLIVDLDERQVMIDSAEEARKLVIAYTLLMLCSVAFFIMLPLLPSLLDVIAPLSTPRDTLSILNGEFLVYDREAHYWLFYLSDALSVLLVMAIVVSIDTAYIACIGHCLGLFAVINSLGGFEYYSRLNQGAKHRLQRPDQFVHNGLPEKDESYEAMTKIIQLHQRVLQFTSILGDSYSLCFLALMMLHVMQLPTVSVLILINIDQPVHLLRYGFVFLALTVHQFSLHWVAQRLTNASDNIFIDAYCNEWYSSSPRTKKLLSFFMLRCTEPSIISAGGIIDMGMETFYGLTGKAISYITVLASFR